MANDLPSGFVLDEEPKNFNLPSGFVLDEERVGGVFGSVPKSAYERGDRNIVGDIFERPGAAIRSTLQGKGYRTGMVNPAESPRFQDLAVEGYYKRTDPAIEQMEQQFPIAGKTTRIARDLGGNIVSGAGFAADVATDPVALLSMILGKAPTGPKLNPNIARATGRSRETLGQVVDRSKPAQALGDFLTKERSIPRAPFLKSQNVIDDVIDEGISRGVKPTTVGKRDATQIKKYKENSREAVKTILDNKENLQFVDDSGKVMQGELPRNLEEFSQAIQQTKRQVYSQIDDLTKQSGETLDIDLKGLRADLLKVRNNKSVKLNDPSIEGYIDDFISNVEDVTGGTYKLKLKDADELLQKLNNDLTSFYKSSYKPKGDTSRAAIDHIKAYNLRNAIDEKILGETGASIKPLKARYGALKAIEADVAKRSGIYGRRNYAGFFDLTDVFTTSDIVQGVVSFNPGLVIRGVAGKAVKGGIKSINDPNNVVRKMFESVGKNYQTRTLPLTPEVLNRPTIPTSRQTNIPYRQPLGLPQPKDVPYDPSQHKVMPRAIRTPYSGSGETIIPPVSDDVRRSLDRAIQLKDEDAIKELLYQMLRPRLPLQ